MRSIIAFAIGIIYMQSVSFAQTYYVDPVNGLDNNSGTSTGSAFKTLAKARNAVKTMNANMTADITVYLRGGWHLLSSTLTFDQTISGTNGHNVIFAAYPGEYPVISGGTPVTGWSLHDAAKKIWQASAPAGIGNRQLYVNCVRAVRAHKGLGLPGAVKTSNGYTTTDQTMQNWKNISDIEFVYNGLQGGSNGAQWMEERCGVAGIAGTTITMKTPGWTNCDRIGNAGQGVSIPTDIENAYELLDQPGEWYFDRSAALVYYIPRTGEDIATACVIAPVLDTLVSAVGTLSAPIHNLEFKGIMFAYATWLVPSGNEGFPEDQANYCAGAIGWPPGNLIFRAARHIRFESCIFKHLGGAICLDIAGGSQNNVIAGCCFTDISGNAIQVGNTSDPVRANANARDTGNQVIDCYIHDVCCEYRGGVGVFCGYVSSALVSHNEICNTPYTGLSCGWGWGTNSYAQNNTFTYNYIHNFCELLGDGGGIYTLSNQPGTKWNNNWFDSMPSRENGGAIYPDEGSGNMEIDSNVCSNIGNKWLHLWINTIHDIAIHDIWSNTAASENNGINCTVTNLTVVTNGIWPSAAVKIKNNAGIDSAYRSIKTVPSADSLSCPGQSPSPVILPGNRGDRNQLSLGLEHIYFNHGISLRYLVPEKTRVRISVFDIDGRFVRVLCDGMQEKGSHTICWNARQQTGQYACAGIYIARLELSGKTISQKMVYAK